jgi:hypothetical protein
MASLSAGVAAPWLEDWLDWGRATDRYSTGAYPCMGLRRNSPVWPIEIWAGHATTTDSVISAGHITAEIKTTASDDPSLPVLGSDNQKIIGGCENRQ